MSDYLDMLKDIRKETELIGKKNRQLAKKYKQKFFTGRITISDGLKSMGYTIDSIPLAEQFEKFIKCNWGEGEEDAEINKQHIKNGYGDVVGIYDLDGHEIWIQTDLCENTVTTIYLPDE